MDHVQDLPPSSAKEWPSRAVLWICAEVLEWATPVCRMFIREEWDASCRWILRPGEWGSKQWAEIWETLTLGAGLSPEMFGWRVFQRYAEIAMWRAYCMTSPATFFFFPLAWTPGFLYMTYSKRPAPHGHLQLLLSCNHLLLLPNNILVLSEWHAKTPASVILLKRVGSAIS